MVADHIWKCLRYEVKLRFLSYFQLWPVAISKPVELGGSYIPFWKGQIQGLLQYGPITELIFWKSYLETKSSKVLVISFEHLQKLCIFAKFGRHSSKIEPATPISISKCFGRKFKFERTKSLQILSKVVSYCDLQLVKIWYWYLKPLLINSKITNFSLTS